MHTLIHIHTLTHIYILILGVCVYAGLSIEVPPSIQAFRHLGGDTKGWLRLVGSFKSYVSFAEYSLFYGALLQKRPIILRSLLIEATLRFRYRHLEAQERRSWAPLTTPCGTLQHNATHALQHTATCCNTGHSKENVAVEGSFLGFLDLDCDTLQHAATYCNILQHRPRKGGSSSRRFIPGLP